MLCSSLEMLWCPLCSGCRLRISTVGRITYLQYLALDIRLAVDGTSEGQASTTYENLYRLLSNQLLHTNGPHPHAECRAILGASARLAEGAVSGIKEWRETEAARPSPRSSAFSSCNLCN